MRVSAAHAQSRTPAPTFDALAHSFEAFYATHRTRIAQAVALTVGDANLADDATSEAMIKAHQRWADVSHFDNPSGWTYRVALNHARGWRRTILRRRTTPGNVPDIARADSPIDDGELAAKLAALPHAFRGVVVCRLFLDWSTEETATALGVAPGTVKSRLARSLQQLRSMIEEDR